MRQPEVLKEIKKREWKKAKYYFDHDVNAT